MLTSLSISNYILIDSLETSFPEGLIIISGETGAGKSILLGALSLALGAKADASMVGPKGDKCIVEAVFDNNGEELILRRSVASSGRSRSFVNDEPVPLDELQEMASSLVDIHSQHQSLKLQDQRFRLEALDLMAGSLPLKEECAGLWASLQQKRKEVGDLQAALASALREQDFNEIRYRRLADAALAPGELEALEAEQKQLSHAEEIKLILCEGEALLSGDDVSLTQKLREGARLLEKAGKYIPSLLELSGRLNSTRLELEDIAAEISAENSRADASPERLMEVEDRLSLLYSLMQKHGVSSVEALIQERDSLAGLVGEASSLSQSLESAQKELHSLEKRHSDICVQLHGKRIAAAGPFAAAVISKLRGLDLENSLFQVKVGEGAPGPSGADVVDFLFSASGNTLQDVSKAASGGELSRIMLSLKAVMAQFRKMPSLVFDEIDSGVSGSTADKMGSLVCEMGKTMQVFAITHLPQVAAKGNAHFLVSKSGNVSSIRLLDTQGRILEIARMLSGAEITPAAIENAKSLLSL